MSDIDEDLALLTKNEWFKVDEFFRKKIDSPLWKVGLYESPESSLHEASEHALNTIVKLLPAIKKSTRVLCLGAHSVNIAYYLVEEFGCKVDVNVHPDIAEKYKYLAEKEPFNKKFVISKAESTALPYTRETFDLAINLDFMGVSERQSKIIREVGFVLKPKGRFLFSTVFLKDKSAESSEAEMKAELKDIAEYQKIGHRSDLQRIIKRELTDQLIRHYAELKLMVTDNYPEAKKKIGKATADKLVNWYGDRGDVLENGNSAWGILVFQKQNA